MKQLKLKQFLMICICSYALVINHWRYWCVPPVYSPKVFSRIAVVIDILDELEAAFRFTL